MTLVDIENAVSHVSQFIRRLLPFLHQDNCISQMLEHEKREIRDILSDLCQVLEVGSCQDSECTDGRVGGYPIDYIVHECEAFMLFVQLCKSDLTEAVGDWNLATEYSKRRLALGRALRIFECICGMNNGNNLIAVDAES